MVRRRVAGTLWVQAARHLRRGKEKGGRRKSTVDRVAHHDWNVEGAGVFPNPSPHSAVSLSEAQMSQRLCERLWKIRERLRSARLWVAIVPGQTNDGSMRRSRDEPTV